VLFVVVGGLTSERCQAAVDVDVKVQVGTVGHDLTSHDVSKVSQIRMITVILIGG
jgi:hypothetical protein